jgi:nicotinamidase-related amidase
MQIDNMTTRRILRLIRENTAFLCCDIQSVFQPTIYHFDHVAHTADVLVQAARILQIPLVVSEQYPEKLGRTLVDVSSAHTVFSKTAFSMLTDSFPADMLNARDTYVLFGIEAHVCVQQTALDLLTRGKQVVIVTDAVSSSRPLDRSTALHRLSCDGVILMTAESVMFEIMRSKDVPEFKEISSLSKQIAKFAMNGVGLSNL